MESEFFDPFSESGGGLPVPPIDTRLGHWFACGEVHVVFPGDDGRQFFLIKETLERCHGTFLDTGQTWARRDEPAPLRGIARDEAMPRAYHEAGHAVACVAEGIKVEYVTILPHMGWGGERLLGYCQYDYRLPEALKHDCPAWAEKAAKADLGGPVADHLYRSLKGVEVPEDVRYAWQSDRGEARRHLADKAAKEGKEIDLDRELDRLFDAVAARFQEPWAWVAISRVADRLCDEGAVSGQVVQELVEQAKAGHGGTVHLPAIITVEENREISPVSPRGGPPP
jgi:hypothetical protein